MYQEKHSLENYNETDEASAYAHAALDSPTSRSDCFGALFPDLTGNGRRSRGPGARQEFGISQLRPFPIGDNYIRNPGNLESLAETTMLRQG
jgi:hypothetical protein